MFDALDISTSALVAQRRQLDTISGNIANAHTTRDVDGQPNPYRRRVALFASGDPSRGREAPGVHVARIVEDPAPFHLKYEPWNPDAIASGPRKGYVRLPNVDLSTEMINAMFAVRAYEANVTVMEITKSMAASDLRLLA
jgi:flagellar basal-body rod protein FlgC